MISIVIPAKNEEKRIGDVIDFCKNTLKDQEKEVIVVLSKDTNDMSERIAIQKGVKVIRENKGTGKGSGMEAGVGETKGEIIIFTDADIENPYPQMMELLSEPILNNRADFVKGSYTNIGVTTEFVVKPLLLYLFPELCFIKQPLSGQIAGRREFFKKVTFEPGWGVDIGILIDMFLNNARIKDVPLPYKDDYFKPHLENDLWCEQIVGAILRRAKKNNRISKIENLQLPLLLRKFQVTLEKEL